MRVSRRRTRLALVVGVAVAALPSTLFYFLLVEPDAPPTRRAPERQAAGVAPEPESTVGARGGSASTFVIVPDAAFAARAPDPATFVFSEAAFSPLDRPVPASATRDELLALAMATDGQPANPVHEAEAVSRLLRSNEGSELLASHLSELSVAQRAWAVDLVASQGSGQHLSLVQKALEDPNPGIRARAQAALQAVQARLKGGEQ